MVDEARSAVGARADLGPAVGDQRLQVARAASRRPSPSPRRGRSAAPGRGASICEQQRVLGRLQARRGDDAVIVLADAARQLAQLEVGAALRRGGGDSIFVACNNCSCNCSIQIRSTSWPRSSVAAPADHLAEWQAVDTALRAAADRSTASPPREQVAGKSGPRDLPGDDRRRAAGAADLADARLHPRRGRPRPRRLPGPARLRPLQPDGHRPRRLVRDPARLGARLRRARRSCRRARPTRPPSSRSTSSAR